MSHQNKVQFGGLNVDVVEVATLPNEGYITSILTGFKSLLKGMKITLSYFGNPKTVVTRQYPENRDTLKITDRAGSQLKLKFEPNGDYRCPGCKICEKACPNATITIFNQKGVSKRQELTQFIWRMDTCTFCNACVAACPYDAIEFVNNFESAVFDRRTLVYNLNPYAGPPSTFLESVTDPEEKAKMKVPVGVYDGTPMAGVVMDGCAPIGTPESKLYDIRREEKGDAK